MVLAALLVIGLGYFGEIGRTDMTLRSAWGGAGKLEFESQRVKRLFGNMRLLLLASWGFYPIGNMLPMLGLTGGTAEVAVQVGNSVADTVISSLL